MTNINTTKAGQVKLNRLVETHFAKAMDEMKSAHTEWQRLYYCYAETCKTKNYIILKSYHTIIAVIDRNSLTCYDNLRQVYGFTRTSAQHIAKFQRKFHTEFMVRYYDVK